MSRRALSPVGRETLHDRVYAELRRSLIHGMFDAGDMLRRGRSGLQDPAAERSFTRRLVVHPRGGRSLLAMIAGPRQID